MKISIGILLIALSILTYSCKKDKNQTITDTNFYITGLKNNNSWTGTPFAGILGDTLFISGGLSQEGVRMKIKFNSVNSYVLTGNQSDLTQSINGAVTAQYKLRTDTVSQVNITAYDATNQIYEGNFTLKLVQSYPISANPVRVSFTNGKFRMRRGGFEQ
jgi:hypothetical protein